MLLKRMLKKCPLEVLQLSAPTDIGNTDPKKFPWLNTWPQMQF